VLRPSDNLGEPTVAVVRPIRNSQGDRERMVAVAESRRLRDYLGISGLGGLYSSVSDKFTSTNFTSPIY
jgi:hypothetical protein